MDVWRCPLNTGDLVRVDRGVLDILVTSDRDHSMPMVWLVTDHKGLDNSTWHPSLETEPMLFENFTVRHRLDRAVHTVQRALRTRRLSLVLKRLGKHHLPEGVCDLIAGYAVGYLRASSPLETLPDGYLPRTYDPAGVDGPPALSLQDRRHHSRQDRAGDHRLHQQPGKDLDDHTSPRRHNDMVWPVMATVSEHHRPASPGTGSADPAAHLQTPEAVAYAEGAESA